jgi:phenylacetate-CoA ligase
MNIIKIIDILTSKNVEKYYRLYKNSQWFSKQKMELFQLDKLKKLIYHCYKNVPYYKNIMLVNGINPQMISSLKDIDHFPILTKEIIKEHYNQFIPTNIKKIKGVKISQTGGTTGNILYTRNDTNTRSSVWAAYKRFEDWMGITKIDQSLILMGGHVIGKNYYEIIKQNVYNYLTNRITFNPYDTSEENIKSIVNVLKNKNISLIRSYSQFLYFLANRLKKEKFNFNIKAITTTAEPLLPKQRKLFTEIFNAKIFDQYGCGEIGGVAFECEHHRGLHITEEHVIVEINKKNELIITDLDNYSLPFIRYFNGDQAIISKNLCSCGRKSKLIKRIMGRTCDYIIGINGEFLHWAYFWHLFFDSNISEKRNIRKFQILQISNTELKIRLISEPLNKDEKQMIINNIQSRIGKMIINFSFEINIENTASGKYRPVINYILK